MKKIRIKLQTKITALIVALVVISIYSTMFFAVQQMVRNLEREIETNIMNVAKLLATSPIVVQGMQTGDYRDSGIQPYVEEVLAMAEQVEIITVADMQGLRYGHPFREMLGQQFVGGDEIRVLERGETYLSEATGTLGTQIRAFVPVVDSNTGAQLGFVMVGNLRQTVSTILRQRVNTLLLISSVGLFLGVLGAVVLASNTKKVLLGMEPEEISQLYLQNQGMLEALHEGVVAIDAQCSITLINESARELLAIENEHLRGMNIREVLPYSKLPTVLETGISEYDREEVIDNTFIIVNRVPIRDKDRIVGAIATFRDKTLVVKLAEEVTGVRQIVEALRANTHEFMNKLHVVLGLMEAGELSEAKRYITAVTANQQQIIRLVMDRLQEPLIAGLLLGKISRAKELGIALEIDPVSRLEKQENLILANGLVTIIGNFMENAMDVLGTVERKDKRIRLKVLEMPASILVEVEDNGPGLDEEHYQTVFKRGYSTKPGSNGIGLALVKELIDNFGGDVSVTSERYAKTVFTANVPKGSRHD